MNDDRDEISKSLGAATGVAAPERKQIETVTDVKALTSDLREKQKKNFENDYTDVRNNLKETIDESMSLLPELIRLTREAQSPPMYLAASSFIKTIADLNKDLLGVSATKDPVGKPAPQPTDPDKKEGSTTVFIGTSEEVFRKFSQRKQGTEATTTQDADFVVVADSRTEPAQESNK